MKRATIDYGIDLGTTNSTIAEFTGGGTEVVKNIENQETTPSAVYVDGKGRLFVGRQAKEQVEADPDNAKQEFKRQMGKPDPLVFGATGRKMLPEELSAEVLKELRKNVAEHSGEDVSAAVITVPADFNAAQVEATNRAARLAGLRQSPLLQEPVAAAMAYGFQSHDEDSRWLVYDFGGGTFDAALIKVREGIIQVEDHAGDKYLGGKNMDWAIVEEILAPAAAKSLGLADFRRGNDKWISAFAKLKLHAETAKIRLSRSKSAVVHVMNLDGRGGEFDFELQQADVERLAAPFIRRSVDLCRQVLKQNRLGSGDLERVLLVGGPTLMPVLRQMLADSSVGLGIPLAHGVDPFTVVARGAAIFAATQPRDISDEERHAGEYLLKLDYKAIGPDPEPLVTGQLLGADGEDFSRWTLEFVNPASRPPWNSGKLGLTADGRFMATLWASAGAQNNFEVLAHDGSGTRQQLKPGSFPYSVKGGVVEHQPLIHPIGVQLSGNNVERFFEKGTPLPARKRHVFVTSAEARRGAAGHLIRVPVVEGPHRRADRNDRVGCLDIPCANLKRDVPAGSEVEVTVEANESRRFFTRVYIPVLNEEFETELIRSFERLSPAELRKEAGEARKRLDDLRGKAGGDQHAEAMISELEDQMLPQELDKTLQAANNDEDAADRAASLVKDLQARLDAVEDAVAWPRLVAEAEDVIREANDKVKKHGKPEDQRALRAHEDEVRSAITRKDEAHLKLCVEEMQGFMFRVWQNSSEFWLGLFSVLEQDKDNLSPRAEAERLLANARRAILSDDVSGLRSACQALMQLRGGGGRGEIDDIIYLDKRGH